MIKHATTKRIASCAVILTMPMKNATALLRTGSKNVELHEKMIAGVKAKKISQKKMIIGRRCVGPIRRKIGGETSVIETVRGVGERFRSCERQ